MKVLIADQTQVAALPPREEAIEVRTWVEIGGRHFGSAAGE
jgi:hypothetical protein